MSRLMIPVAVLLLAAGCTRGHFASPRIQSQNLSDLYQQQVLENLAMYIENSQGMPGGAAKSENYKATIANISAATAGDQRESSQLASRQQSIPVASHGLATIPAPSHRSMYADHQTGGSTDGRGATPSRATSGENGSPSVSHAASPKCGCKKCVAQRNTVKPVVNKVAKTGKTTNNDRWYAAGKSKDVPANYDGQLGRYEKTRVWVPSSGKSQFKQLVASVMNQTRWARGTSSQTEDIIAGQAKRAAVQSETVAVARSAEQASPAPTSYRVIAASIAVNRDPLEAGRRANSAQDNSRLVRQLKPVIPEEPAEEPAVELAVEPGPLKFDRELSLQALSTWDSDDETADLSGTSQATGSERVAELEAQGIR